MNIIICICSFSEIEEVSEWTLMIFSCKNNTTEYCSCAFTWNEITDSKSRGRQGCRFFEPPENLSKRSEWSVKVFTRDLHSEVHLLYDLSTLQHRRHRPVRRVWEETEQINGKTKILSAERRLLRVIVSWTDEVDHYKRLQRRQWTKAL